MVVESLFTVPLYSYDTQINTDKIVDSIYTLEYKNSLPNKVKQSTNTFLHKENIFNEISNEILINTKTFMQQLGYEYCDLMITQMWANLYDPGVAIHPHVHSNSMFSGILYLTTNNDGETVFVNPMCDFQQIITAPIKEYTRYTAASVDFLPQKNRITLFPSWLRHKSKPSESNRISLSFNILPKKLGSIQGLNYAELVTH